MTHPFIVHPCILTLTLTLALALTLGHLPIAKAPYIRPHTCPAPPYLPDCRLPPVPVSNRVRGYVSRALKHPTKALRSVVPPQPTTLLPIFPMLVLGSPPSGG